MAINPVEVDYTICVYMFSNLSTVEMIGVFILSALSFLIQPLQCLSDQEVLCGVPRKHGLILVDDIVGVQEHPWHSVLFHWFGSRWEYQCGGTLINQRFVITAHHCTLVNGVGYQVPTKNLLVKLGLQEIDRDNLHSQSYSVSGIYTAEDEQLVNFRNDIALIELNETVRFSEYILPACLMNQVAAMNEIGTVVGYSTTENGTITKSLRIFSVPVVASVKCLTRHKEFTYRINGNHFCAGYSNGRGVCYRDSEGGIIFRRNETMQLGGIVSYATARGRIDSKCKESGYAVYTNVYDFLPWIEQTIKDAELRQRCGRLRTNSTMIMRIYQKLPESTIWFQSCVGAVISQSYVLAIGCKHHVPDNRYDLRVALIDLPWIFDAEFSNEYYRDVESFHAHPVYIALLRLKQNIVFDNYVHPICLPTLEELQPITISDLISYSNYKSLVFRKISNSRRSLKMCKTHCPGYKEANSENLLCLGKNTDNCNESIIGFYSRRNGIQKFVLLGGFLYNCLDDLELYFKFNYQTHIQWIYKTMKP